MEHFLKQFEFFLQRNLPQKNSDYYTYPLIPPGKIFRSKVAQAVMSDLGTTTPLQKKDLLHFQFFLEIMHTYTLVHDDLPAMDNDDERRGRPTVHKKFGEWQGILSGDGLQTLSFKAMATISPEILPTILSLSTWAVGAKGLIQGQALDLSQEMSKDFATLTRTHELKTGRLFQLAIAGPLAIFKQSLSYKDLKLALRIGKQIGLAFQWVDDWDDFQQISKTQQNSGHEHQINPFIIYPEQTRKTLKQTLEDLWGNLQKEKWSNLEALLKPYFIPPST